MNHFMKFFYFQKSSHRRSFTLVELLIVVAIIGLLTAFAVFSITPALAKARDAKRAQALKSLSTTLELYLADSGSYPNGAIGPSSSDSSYGFCLEQSTDFATLMSSYMAQIPKDPLFQDTVYPDHCYWYRTANSGSQYHISTYIESSNYAPAINDGGQETTSYEVYGGNNANQLTRGDILVSRNNNNAYYFDRAGSVLNGKTGFYVFQYEAKYDSDGDGIGNDADADHRVDVLYDTYDWNKTDKDGNKVVSSPEGSPIAGITHTDALSACPTGYHLITNDEWMAIARDAEQVSSNWANSQIGSTVASGGGLKRGNVGISDSASYNGADP
ncbi:MAG: type II secretion system protein, partial [Patescibacteria group bacterium]|nr:type II secretion system protein [Patescibacteria group bacterium]